MFTGIVEEVGEIVSVRAAPEAVGFDIEAPGIGAGLAAGDSVSVSGVCLTATGLRSKGFSVEAVGTTRSRTTAAEWGRRTRVNLERALRAGQPMGGHLVQGHVDGVGEVVGVEAGAETAKLRVRLPPAVARVTVDRGSLAIDGVSLTVASLDGAVAEFAIIPYTWSHTTLRLLAPGARVNVEADLIGKYVERLVRPYGAGSPQGGDAGGPETPRSTG